MQLGGAGARQADDDHRRRDLLAQDADLGGCLDCDPNGPLVGSEHDDSNASIDEDGIAGTAAEDQHDGISPISRVGFGPKSSASLRGRVIAVPSPLLYVRAAALP